MDDKYYMEYAKELSKKANCIKGQVGAIIVKDNEIVAKGVNSVPNGIEPCTAENSIRKLLKLNSGERPEICFVVHAEQTALLDALDKRIDIKGSTVYVTKQPCMICAKMLINAGIKRIVYLKPYPDMYSEKIIKDAKIELERYEENNG